MRTIPSICDYLTFLYSDFIFTAGGVSILGFEFLGVVLVIITDDLGAKISNMRFKIE